MNTKGGNLCGNRTQACMAITRLNRDVDGIRVGVGVEIVVILESSLGKARGLGMAWRRVYWPGKTWARSDWWIGTRLWELGVRWLRQAFSKRKQVIQNSFRQDVSLGGGKQAPKFHGDPSSPRGAQIRSIVLLIATSINNSASSIAIQTKFSETVERATGIRMTFNPRRSGRN